MSDTFTVNTAPYIYEDEICRLKAENERLRSALNEINDVHSDPLTNNAKLRKVFGIAYGALIWENTNE